MKCASSFPFTLPALALSICCHLAPVVRADVQLPSGVQRITSVEGITEYELANGLRVLLFPDTSKPIVTVNITYKVGSRHEGYGEKGMAHLLEHLLFKGTPKHRNIPEELTKHGARANGTTYFDRTNYYETVDATEENLAWALDLEADRMVNSFVSRNDLLTEFSVVRNEYERSENSPSGVLNTRMLAAVFQWHNYGHSTIGEKSDIENAPIERLQAFYRNYYQPDNAVLVVAGNVDEEKVLGQINARFSMIPRPARKLIPTYTAEPVQDGERQVTLRRTGDVQLFSCMFRSASSSHPDYAALRVLANLLSDSPSGRLYKQLVETKKAASIWGYAQGMAEAGILNFGANVRKEQSLEEARKALMAVLDELQSKPPTAEEVQRAKARLLKQFELSFKQSDSVALRLTESIADGDWRLLFLSRDNLEKVTPEQVAQVVRKYFKPANRTLGYFIPDEKPDRSDVPAPPDLSVVLKEYQGKAALAKGEDFDPSPENIEKRVTRGRLENGLRYALLPKKTRGEAVTANVSLHFGSLETLRGKATPASFAGDMLDRGSTQYTRQQIKDTFDKLKATVSFYGGESTAGFSITTDREHFLEALRIASEVIRTPLFPENEFATLKQQMLAGLEQRKSQPDALANNLYSRISHPAYPKDDPRYTRTFEEESAAIEATTLEQVREFYKKFYGASHALVAIVGDFDKEAARQALEKDLGDWKNPGHYERIPSEYEPLAARNESIKTPDKKNAVYLAGFRFPMRDDDPRFAPLTIGGYIMGGGFLNSRLATRIRQKDGLSYGVGGGFSASSLDTNASFSASMIYNPTNVTRLEIAFREEVERAAKEGFTREELESAKSGWLKSRKVSRSSDRSLAGQLSNALYTGRDLLWNAKQEEQIRNLTLAEVNEVLKKHLDYAKMIVVKAGDFK
jgi:zinc protease